jgi:hypothetical protein
MAPANSTISVAHGSYGTPSNRLTDAIEDSGTAAHLHIRGPATGALPTIYTAAFVGIDLTNASSVSRVAIDSSGSLGALAVAYASSANHVKATASSGEFGACSLDDSTLTDSECIATGDGVDAIQVSGYASETATVRGVTAVATGATGSGIRASEMEAGDNISVSVVNSILSGASGSATAAASTGSSATVTLVHSDAVLDSQAHNGGTETVTTNATDISKAPKFVSATTGNYAEAKGSPTINKGAADPSTDTDLAGHARTVGSAPDMGALEFLQKAALSHLKITKRGTESLRGSVRINAEGVATKVRIIVTRHGKQVEAQKAPKTYRHRATVHFAIHLLGAGRTYRIHAVADQRRRADRNQGEVRNHKAIALGG